jgi:hypothetical protein
MATERNPFDMIPETETNVIAMVPEEQSNVSIEIDPTDGGVIVDFSSEEAMMEPSEEISEWYGDLSRLKYLVPLHQIKRCSPIEFRTL